MSLLQTLPYGEYVTATKFSSDTCEMLAKLAKIRKTYNEHEKPGEQLMIDLDRRGLSVSEFRKLLDVANGKVTTQLVTSGGFRPTAKVAVLIGNSNYTHLGKLITPSIDCKELGEKLKSLGFIVVILKDVDTSTMKKALASIFQIVTPNSYCVIFYGGHGFELCAIKYALGVDCPSEDITTEHGLSVNRILKEVSVCRPELCVLLMDMCRNYLDRESYPALFSIVPDVEKFHIEGNLVIGYSTSSDKSAYEQIQIVCSTSESLYDSQPVTYELKSEEYGCVVGLASQYVSALCRHLSSKLSMGEILDRVGEDLQNAMKKQTPLKTQSGSAKRYLYDRISGDHHKLMRKLRQTLSSDDLAESCTVLDIV